LYGASTPLSRSSSSTGSGACSTSASSLPACDSVATVETNFELEIRVYWP